MKGCVSQNSLGVKTAPKVCNKVTNLGGKFHPQTFCETHQRQPKNLLRTEIALLYASIAYVNYMCLFTTNTAGPNYKV